jgi:hypothetical protein
MSWMPGQRNVFVTHDPGNAKNAKAKAAKAPIAATPSIRIDRLRPARIPLVRRTQR